MSAIMRLPDDLLSILILLATNKSIEDKFAVAQVSKRWRGVAQLALGSALLWSSFRLMAGSDCSRLQTLLARSRCCTLDITLQFMRHHAVGQPVVEMLAAHASRIRALEARLSDGSEHQIPNLAPPLTADLDFPILETLRVSVGTTDLGWAAHRRCAYYT
ncbi:hypothetical protein AURDEDRAFT_167020 [Auricularia subglabra TFB-10046 SS5]|nr:hypothetical protein AURDEDRAFT_167020 [Auricularia subglabra TFB-10046 SS5]